MNFLIDCKGMSGGRVCVKYVHIVDETGITSTMLSEVKHRRRNLTERNAMVLSDYLEKKGF